MVSERTCLAIVLAAGEGTRMRSARPKVLHRIAGRSLLAHVLDAVSEAGATATAVVVGPGSDAVAAEAKRVLPDAEIFVQSERRGTAHAVLAARGAITRMPDDVLVIFGDTPLVRPQTLLRIREGLRKGAGVVVLGFRPRNATGYGRLVVEGGELVAIREELDASPAERAIELCNGGFMAFSGPCALPILERIGNDNRKGEYYLTDAIAIARAMGHKTIVIETEARPVGAGRFEVAPGGLNRLGGIARPCGPVLGKHLGHFPLYQHELVPLDHHLPFEHRHPLTMAHGEAFRQHDRFGIRKLCSQAPPPLSRGEMLPLGSQLSLGGRERVTHGSQPYLGLDEGLPKTRRPSARVRPRVVAEEPLQPRLHAFEHSRRARINVCSSVCPAMGTAAG